MLGNIGGLRGMGGAKNRKKIVSLSVMKGKHILLGMVLWGLGSCGTFGLYSGEQSAVVASVGNIELRASALEGIYSGVLSPEDSAKVRDAFIASWIRDEIRRQQAEKALAGEEQEAQIERMVREYRAQLITFAYENDFIAHRIDTTVTAAQIDKYYSDHSDDFRLVGPLVKAVVVRLPSGLRQSKRLEDLFRSDRESAREDFMRICQKNDYRVDDFSTQWTDFGVVLQHLPFAQKNFDEFLKKSKFYEVSDDEWKYMMRIDAYMPTGALSPREREEGTIVKILRNLRRGELLTALDDSLHQVAVREGVVHITPWSEVREQLAEEQR